MPTITNELNLPQALVTAVTKDTYDNGGAWRSVTQLCAPPRQVLLKKRHDHEIVEDVSDMLYRLYGQIVHGILERANVKDLVEKRIFMKVKGKLISGAFDSVILTNDQQWKCSDWKFSSFQKASGETKEWLWQMNFLRILLLYGYWDKELTTHPVKWPSVDELEVVLMMRDHKKRKARMSAGYPKRPIARLPFQVWPDSYALKFLHERVELHLQAENALPDCSPDDRWAQETVFAVMKEGRKSAVKLYPNDKNAALSHATTIPHAFVQERPGENIRCEDFCSAAPFCSQFLETQRVANVK
jgi:hypothetical protein